MGIGIAVGMIVSGVYQARSARKTAQENMDHTDKRDKQLRKDQDRRAKDAADLQRELYGFSRETQDLVEAQRFEYQKDLINYHRDMNNYPLREPLSILDSRSLHEALRIFLVPPEEFSIRSDGNSRAWNNVHTHAFTESIRAFFQAHYSEHSLRPVKLYEPSILNHGGYRSSNAVDLLQQSFTTHPTVWVESNRTGSGCSLGMSQWGGDLGSASFRTLGSFPNYDLALGKQNKMGLFLLGQQQQEIEETIKEVEHNFPCLDAKAAELMREGVSNLVRQYQSQCEPSTQEKIDDAAAVFLADAYKMLIASVADIYFLAKGVTPLLPQLINSGHLAMDDKFIQGATSQLVSEYMQTSAQMASQMPELASIIWVGVAEMYICLNKNELAARALTESLSIVNKNGRFESSINSNIQNGNAKLMSEFLSEQPLEQVIRLSKVSGSLLEYKYASSVSILCQQYLRKVKRDNLGPLPFHL